MIDPTRVAKELARIFPDLDAKLLLARFTDGRSFLWIRKTLSPEQMQQVHDIGDPGLLFGPREMRLYPNGRLAAHVLGGASFGAEGRAFRRGDRDRRHRKGAGRAAARSGAWRASPWRCRIDLTVQATTQEVLEAGMKMMNAKGAAAILMDVRHGRDPGACLAARLRSRTTARSPWSRAIPATARCSTGRCRGSTSLARPSRSSPWRRRWNLGLVNPETMVDANAPMIWGKHRIKEFENKNYGPLLSVSDVIAKSSNVGTAHIALMIGPVRQQAFLKSLGFFEPTPVELIEAPGAKPADPEALGRDRHDHHVLRARHVGQPDAPCGRLCDDREWRRHGQADAAEARRRRPPACA